MEVERIEGRKRCCCDGDMMAEGRPGKLTDSGAMEKTRGVLRRWKWRQKTDRHICALEDNNDNRNEADKVCTEAVDNS